MTCGYAWEGKRALRVEDRHGRVRIYRFQDEPLRGGMTDCWLNPEHMYVEWVNAVEILAALGRYWED